MPEMQYSILISKSLKFLQSFKLFCEGDKSEEVDSRCPVTLARSYLNGFIREEWYM